ncbi:hypothetical protein DXG01_014194 [Tephrocybe rancida]|nr:hypothetical protein DXG01_014194 [Tephrocybe rancida]
MPACPYCSAYLCTAQGLNSHLLRVPACCKQFLNIHTSIHGPTKPSVEDVPLNFDAGPDFALEDPPFNAPFTDQEVPPPSPSPWQTPTFEDNIDDSNADTHWVEEYPGEAGSIYGTCETTFETLQRKQEAAGLEPWAPFATEAEWELAQWLMMSGVSQAKMDSFLKLETELMHLKIRDGAKPTFHNAHSLLKQIDKLPRGPGWICKSFRLTGDKQDSDGNFLTQEVELWHQDPVTCIKELLESPFIGEKNAYEPTWVYRDEAHTNHEYSKTNTGEWMWEMQGYQLFHDCMKRILEPLVKAGKEGVNMKCADGFVHKVYPILAAYIGDYPEQGLVVCCQENSCPTCTVQLNKHGDPIHSVLRDPKKTLDILKKACQGLKLKAFEDQSLRPVKPFWRNLPHCNIFSCITPDILHQLHKGMFKDHIIKRSTEAILLPKDEDEVDRRFRSMTPHPMLHHFKKGIKLTSQWTGTKYKNMEKVFLGILAGAMDPAVIQCIRGALDFIYYAQFKVHTDKTLAQLDAAWAAFHENKKVFKDLAI